MLLRHCAIAVVAAIVPLALPAQATRDTSEHPLLPSAITPLVLPGSIVDDLHRTRQIAGAEGTSGSLIRSTGSLTRALPPSRARFSVSGLAPVLTSVYNSAIPVSANDGSLWAGRGTSVRATAGAMARIGRVQLVLAPELAYTQNLATPTLPTERAGMSAFATPWFRGDFSADLPLRFGRGPLTMLTFGQSRIEVDAGPLSVGLTSEDQWWGPGRRNAIVLSNNAPGIPHLFLRTPAPLRTGIGDVEARWILGWLTESIVFDANPGNDLRALSALVATLRPKVEPDLTLGVARAIYTPIASFTGAFTHVADVVARHERVGEHTARTSGASEQVYSLFGRWIFPANGIEVYGEWAKQELPKSIRELLVAPQIGQGFTVGLQAVRPAAGGALRGQLELTTLEQTPPAPGEPPRSFYVSRFIPQGYTHRGQVVGAAIGPGSSSQEVAVDYLRRDWRLGVQLGRTRWQEDVYPTVPTGFAWHAHDVSLAFGLRGGGEFRGVLLDAELVRTHRLNYHFQNQHGGTARDDSFDVRNTTMRVTASFAP